MKQYIGIVGYPLKHSLSPAFQQAALDYYKLDICYQSWETKAEYLSSTINQLRLPQNLGANITVPYKETVIRLLDEVDNFASIIGAVNTIVNRGNKLVGFNTDAYGFIQALRQDAKFEFKNKQVALLGAGGAARAAGFALIQQEINSLAIINRTIERAETLANTLAKYATIEEINTKVKALPMQSSKLKDIVGSCHLVVNCTTLGMRYSAQAGQSPIDADLINQNALIYDLVYNPSETPLLQMAKELGASTLNGLSMLVYQGAAAFEIWTEEKAPIDIMFSVARQALNKIDR